jgi:nicotinamidase-related amidase
MAATDSTRERILARLLAGLPREDADLYRRDFDLQRPWGAGARPAIVVVDMVRAFGVDGMPLGSSATTGPCAEAIGRLLGVARGLRVPIFHTKPGAYPTPVETGAWLRGRSLQEYEDEIASGDLRFLEPVAPLPGEPVLEKPKPSAFFGTQLQSMLRALGIDTVVVTGVGVARCVRATVDDAFALNYRVVVPIDCVAGKSQLSWQVELLDMGVAREEMADLTTGADLAAELRRMRSSR